METISERVPIGEVTDLFKVGEPLPFRVLDALERLLLNEGQHIHSDSQLATLIERGAWVERQAVIEQRARLASTNKTATGAQRTVTLFDRWERCTWELDAVLRAVLKGQPAKAELDSLVDGTIALVDRDVDIALFMAIRQDDRRFALYPLVHALHVTVIGLVTARQAGWGAAKQRSLVGAALTMNVAMLDLQALMAEQDTPPTTRQLDQIRSHTDRSEALLRSAGISDETWLRTVRDHHERPDGTGYPRGLKELSDEARLLRKADVFMAKITPRAKRQPLPPQVAARQLFQQEAGSPLVAALIKGVGIHPPGSLVSLKSGEVAVVARRPRAGNAPLVFTLSDRKGQPSANSSHRDTQQPEFAVVGPLADRTGFTRVLGERVYGVVE
jgi:HD-GYP domain-containing protein (c-di-GMP phosphodiesterase class II)